MSRCISCKYALYSGMCVAQGKYTVLDAKSCDLYEPNVDSRIANLEHENARLREFIEKTWPVIEYPSRWCRKCPYDSECMDTDEDGFVYDGCRWRDEMREVAQELGIGVGE